MHAVLQICPPSVRLQRMKPVAQYVVSVGSCSMSTTTTTSTVLTFGLDPRPAGMHTYTELRVRARFYMIIEPFDCVLLPYLLATGRMASIFVFALVLLLRRFCIGLILGSDF